MKDFIIRKKKGKTYTYQDKKGNPINKKTINKYLDFYIPPAYDDVKINKKNGKVKAIGIDDKNRSQLESMTSEKESSGQNEIVKSDKTLVNKIYQKKFM